MMNRLSSRSHATLAGKSSTAYVLRKDQPADSHPPGTRSVRLLRYTMPAKPDGSAS